MRTSLTSLFAARCDDPHYVSRNFGCSFLSANFKSLTAPAHPRPPASQYPHLVPVTPGHRIPHDLGSNFVQYIILVPPSSYLTGTGINSVNGNRQEMSYLRYITEQSHSSLAWLAWLTDGLTGGRVIRISCSSRSPSLGCTYLLLAPCYLSGRCKPRSVPSCPRWLWVLSVIIVIIMSITITI